MNSLPNLLTISRVVLLVPIVLLLASPTPGIAAYQAAFGLFLAAALSDLLDGWLARRLGCVSNLGAFLDPLADKVMTNVLLVFLAHHAPAAFPMTIVLLLLAREFIVQGFRSMAPCVGIVIRTDLLSKLKTFFQLLAIGAFLVGQGWPVLASAGDAVNLLGLSLALASAYVSMVLLFIRNRDLWSRPSLPMQPRG